MFKMSSQERFPDAIEGALLNRDSEIVEAERLGFDPMHTPPEQNGHYRGLYLHDQVYSAIQYIRADLPWTLERAEIGIKSLLKGQQPNGMIPNQQHPWYQRRFDPETYYWDSPKYSNYSQPPVIAQAVYELYMAKRHQSWLAPDEAGRDADKFVNEVYADTASFYKFWDRERTDGPDDKLIAIICGPESGSDSSTTFDYHKKRLQSDIPGSSAPNTLIDWVSTLRQVKRIKDSHGDMDKLRETFWVKRVDMNCFYVQNLYLMAELAKQTNRLKDVQYFSDLAEKAENQILKEWQPDSNSGKGMWVPGERGGEGDGMLYSLDEKSQPIPKINDENFMALLLPNLPEQQLKAILKTSWNKFIVEGITNFGFPSVPVDSKDYDPHYTEKERLRRGPGWMNTAWQIMEGIRIHINREDISADTKNGFVELLDFLRSSTRNLVDNWSNKGIPFPEFFDTENGAAHRPRVKWFTWNGLAYCVSKDDLPDQTTGALLNYSRGHQARIRKRQAMAGSIIRFATEK